MIKVLYYIILVNNSQGINNIPLIPAIGSKNLDDLPHRILRFSLSLARVDYLIIHVPGDNALHCPEHQDCQNDMELQGATENWMKVAVKNLPATEQRLKEYASAPFCVI